MTEKIEKTKTETRHILRLIRNTLLYETKEFIKNTHSAGCGGAYS
jgi:hypothetical protein